MTARRLPNHSIDKTIAIITLAEALHTATTVGNPAPIVERLREWMNEPPSVGDVVVETSTRHRGPIPSRVGEVVSVSRHRSYYERVTEVLVLDPPCGKEECADTKCIHRWRWSNASFIRIPVTPLQLKEATYMEPVTGDGVGWDDLVAALADAGIEVKP